MKYFEEIVGFWFNLSDKIRFLVIGACNAFVSYLIYVIYCLLFGENNYQVALAVSWAISSIISFSAQKYLVFRSKGNWIKEYLKCCTTWFFSYLINAGLLETFVKIFHLNSYLAQIISTGLTAIFTYVLFKKFAFKKSNN